MKREKNTANDPCHTIDFFPILIYKQINIDKIYIFTELLYLKQFISFFLLTDISQRERIFLLFLDKDDIEC